MKNHIYIQARLCSKRLPNKVLKKILGKTILELMIERLYKVNNIDKIILTTGSKEENNELVNEAKRLKIDYYCGSEENILNRFYQASKKFNSDNIIRIMADSPLIDFHLINKGLEIFLTHDCDILSIDRKPSYPHGLNFQIFSRESLEKSWKDHFKNFNNIKKFENTFISPTIYMLEKKKFKNYDLVGLENTSHLRLTLDYEEDFTVIKKIYEGLYPQKKFFALDDVLNFLKNNPDILDINKKFHKESYSNIKIEK
ncbi:MAG: cytidylyltransferase domain-containing protein [Nitrosopumilaceae archaeon]